MTRLTEKTLDVLAELILADKPLNNYELAARVGAPTAWPVSRRTIYLEAHGLVTKGPGQTRHPVYTPTDQAYQVMAAADYDNPQPKERP